MKNRINLPGFAPESLIRETIEILKIDSAIPTESLRGGHTQDKGLACPFHCERYCFSGRLYIRCWRDCNLLSPDLPLRDF